MDSSAESTDNPTKKIGLIIGLFLVFILSILIVWWIRQSNIDQAESAGRSNLKESTEVEEGSDTAPTELMKNNETELERNTNNSDLQGVGEQPNR